MTNSARRCSVGLIVVAFGLPILALGCPRKAPPAAEEAGPTAPPPASTPEVLELGPLVDEGGTEAPETGPKKYTGGGGGGSNLNQQKIKACCGAMRSQAKTLGPASPEGFQLNALAAQCDVFAAQVGPAGNAPELNQIRQMLKSVKLPAACSF